MDISAALAADLAALTDSLANPDIDLQAQLRALAADLKRAVESYTGLTISIVVDGHDINFSDDISDTAVAVTSLRIPFAVLDASEEPSMLVIYAAIPGAFVDLAADLSFVLSVDPAVLVLDERAPHRSGAARCRPGIRGLDEFSRMNQAIGILIAHGHTPETARLELHRLAGLDGNLQDAADAVFTSLTLRRGTDDHHLGDDASHNDPRH